MASGFHTYNDVQSFAGHDIAWVIFLCTQSVCSMMYYIHSSMRFKINIYIVKELLLI